MAFFKLKEFSGFVVLLYKALVGFLPVHNFTTLEFFKSLSLLKNVSYLEHNHITEQ